MDPSDSWEQKQHQKTEMFFSQIIDITVSQHKKYFPPAFTALHINIKGWAALYVK